VKFWNKETTNENEEYYRTGDWSVERPSDWDNGKNNFTNVPPPTEAFDGVPCNWDEELGQWILDVEQKDRQIAIDALKDSDSSTVRVIEDLVKVLVSNGTIEITDLPQDAQDKLALRNTLRDDL